MKRRVVLSGLGSVGREFIRLIFENGETIRNKYNLELIVCGVLGSKGYIYQEEGLDLNFLYTLYQWNS